jgi:hypothetical protein
MKRKLLGILFMLILVGHQRNCCRKLERRKPWQDELPFDEYKDKVLIKHLKGPLFFWIYNVSQKTLPL